MPYVEHPEKKRWNHANMCILIRQCKALFARYPDRTTGGSVADIQIDEGIIKILNLEIQDPKAAAVIDSPPEQ